MASAVAADSLSFAPTRLRPAWGSSPGPTRTFRRPKGGWPSVEPMPRSRTELVAAPAAGKPAVSAPPPAPTPVQIEIYKAGHSGGCRVGGVLRGQGRHEAERSLEGGEQGAGRLHEGSSE